MKVKIGFKVNDKVTYKGMLERIPARIVAIHEQINSLGIPGMDVEYEIQITSNRFKTYRKGERFRTTGNWLNKR